LADEAPGKIPDLAFHKNEHAANSTTAFPSGSWYTGDNVNMAIGEGELLVTPLQMADAYATFANRGTLYKPQVALNAQTPAGQVVQTYAPEVVRHVNIPDRPIILAGLEGVTGASNGTAYGAFSGFPLHQFRVAGKTATAQVGIVKQDTSVFTSFGPAAIPST
jgi:penicillin-binding protein 2